VGSDDKKMIRSPHTTGVELSVSGTETFHFTFSVSLHVSGGFPFAEIPSKFGPRHVGQLSSASAPNALTEKTHAPTKKTRALTGLTHAGSKPTHRPTNSKYISEISPLIFLSRRIILRTVAENQEFARLSFLPRAKFIWSGLRLNQ
jgi:hypothetical protein